jgi:hypothetical protein
LIAFDFNVLVATADRDFSCFPDLAVAHAPKAQGAA